MTNPVITDDNQRIIVTVLGADRVGIIAGVSGILAENSINILDISQTTLREFFTMIMVADMKNSKINLNTLKSKLAVLGQELGMRIDAVHEDAFRFMHRI